MARFVMDCCLSVDSQTLVQMGSIGWWQTASWRCASSRQGSSRCLSLPVTAQTDRNSRRVGGCERCIACQNW